MTLSSIDDIFTADKVIATQRRCYENESWYHKNPDNLKLIKDS